MPSTEADANPIVTPIVNPGPIEEPHIHVVAGIVWSQQGDDRFLIAKRQPGKHLENHWEFPGGKREAGETSFAALKRELLEEISITVTAASEFMRVYCRYPERNVLLDTWSVTDFEGEAVSAEKQALRWITLDQADAFQWPAADIPIIDAIRNNVRAGTRCSP